MSGYLSLEGLQHFWSKIKSYISSHVVPVTRTVNGKALNQDISLGYSDVGAASSSTVSSLYTTVNTLQTKVDSSGLAYSTTEHVVGTWVDGRPIYERTFTSGFYQGYISSGKQTGILDQADIPGIVNVINISATATNYSGGRDQYFSLPSAIACLYCVLINGRVNIGGYGIKLSEAPLNGDLTVKSVTIQYLK